VRKKRFVGLYIDEDIYGWVEKEAKGKRSSISQVIREAILERMNISTYAKPNGRHKKAATL
jgi:predicted CopG family antitoxin